MAWFDRLLGRQSFQLRPISAILLIVAVSTGSIAVNRWLYLSPAHRPSEEETKAIQVAVANFALRNGRGPSAESSKRAIKLDGTGWVVQITERFSPEPSALRVVNTFHVSGDFRCQWLGLEEWGSY
jgi:hypothetical protein